MPIASFGSKIFTVSQNKIYTLDGFSHTSSLNVEEQEVDGQKPSTYIKSSGLDEISFTIPLFGQKDLDIRKEIEDWIAIKDSKTPYILILGEKPITKNKFLLVNVSIPESIIDGSGAFKKANVQLQFKEFVRYGSKKDSPGTKKESKKDKKRKNENAKTSKQNGAKIDALEQELFGG